MKSNSYKPRFSRLYQTLSLAFLGSVISLNANALGNIDGTNAHDNGVAIGNGSLNYAHNGIAEGYNATATVNNLTRDEYNQQKQAYDALLVERQTLLNQKNDLSNNKDLKDKEITALNTRIAELDKKIIEYGNNVAKLAVLNNQKTTLDNFITDLNQKIQDKQNEYDLLDKSKLNEYTNFTNVLNSLTWSKYAEANGETLLANELKQKVTAFSPNIANSYSDDKYKEIVNAFVGQNSLSKTTTTKLFNELTYVNIRDVTDLYYEPNFIKETNNQFEFIDYQLKPGNKERLPTELTYRSNIYFDHYRHFQWIEKGNNISDSYINKIKNYKNELLNPNNANQNFSLLVTKNIISIALKNRDNSNHNLKILQPYNSKTTNFLIDIYANFKTTSNNDINLVQELQNSLGSNMKLSNTSDAYLTSAFNDATNFINAYESIDLNATKKNVENIEQTRNLFSNYYEKMKQIQEIVTLHREIQSETDNTVKLQKQATYMEKLTAYRTEVNNTTDYDTVENYIAKYVRPNIKYSQEFMQYWADSATEYINFLEANKGKLLNYNENDQLIVDVTAAAKRIQSELDALNQQKTQKQQEIDNLVTQINDVTAKLNPTEEALNNQKQEHQTQLQKAQQELADLTNQITQKEQELANKQQAISDKLKEFSAEGNPIALGDNSFASGASSVAIGVNSEAVADHAVALGKGAKVLKGATDGIAIGTGVEVSGKESIAIGKGSVVSGEKSIAIGVGHNVSGNHSTTIGDPNTIEGNNVFVAGNDNTVKSNNVMVMGNNVTVNTGFDGAVVLGSDSAVAKANPTTQAIIRGDTYTFAGTTPTSVVSVGSKDKERQIVNVAAGRVTSDSTDAINGSQLFAVVEAMNKISTSTSGGTTTVVSGIPNVKGDENITASKDASDNSAIVKLNRDITIDSVTTGNSKLSDNGLVITNGPAVTSTGINAGNKPINAVADGEISATSTQAINGSQLYRTTLQSSQNTQRINNLENRVTKVNKEARAGIAGTAAIAGLPDIHLAGKSMVSAGAGTYKGQNAVAIGYSRLSDNNKVKFKLSGSATTQGDFIGSVGVGYAW